VNTSVGTDVDVIRVNPDFAAAHVETSIRVVVDAAHVLEAVAVLD